MVCFQVETVKSSNSLLLRVWAHLKQSPVCYGKYGSKSVLLLNENKVGMVYLHGKEKFYGLQKIWSSLLYSP